MCLYVRLYSIPNFYIQSVPQSSDQTWDRGTWHYYKHNILVWSSVQKRFVSKIQTGFAKDAVATSGYVGDTEWDKWGKHGEF